MSGKSLVVLVFLAVYLLVMVPGTIYFSSNFSRFVHLKGDEVINYAIALLVTPIVFEILVSLITKVLVWRIFLLSTIINFLLSFVFGFFILVGFRLGGSSQEIILVYGSCFLCMFSIITVIQAYRFSESP
jgi:hypothetical protein